ncbi:class F sortase [bacterium]|nr:class F sortase [bacterium]
MAHALRDYSVSSPNLTSMKTLHIKLVILIFLFICILSAAAVFIPTKPVASGNGIETQVAEETPSVFEDVKPLVTEPVRLQVPTVGLDAQIVSVNVGPDGVMEAPEDWFVVGWYQKSGKVHQEKNMILNGHYDTNTGRPAAFWVLKNIKVGDTVTVTDSYDRHYNYAVVDFLHVDIKDPARLSVLSDADGRSTLTLITCGGVWSPADGTYTKRLVAKAELVQ